MIQFTCSFGETAIAVTEDTSFVTCGLVQGREIPAEGKRIP